MLVEDYLVEVRDPDYIRQGQFVDGDLVDFLVVPRANNVGSWQIVLPQNVLAADGTEVPHALCAQLRTPGAGIVVTNMRTGMVELSGPLTDAEHRASTSDVGGTWMLIGVSDTTILAESEAWPDPTDDDPAYQDVSNDVRTAAAETLLHEFVDANIGPSGTGTRSNPRLTMGSDLGRGPILVKSPRFTNMLTLCQQITTGTNLLFDVVQVGDQLEFRTWEADDLTADIRMDLENGQLAQSDYRYARPTVTHVNVLGQGEGVDRQVISRTSTESLAAAALWGVRIERSIDQRNTDVEDELEQAGDETLAEEGLTITSLRVVPSGDQTDNFGVGDYVTIVVGGQEVQAQVTERPTAINADGVFVGCTVGDPSGFDWESLLASRQASQGRRIAKLERDLEVPGSLYSQAEVDDLLNDLKGTAFRVARNRNRAINGAMNVWQRGASFVNPASGAYTADRWKIGYDGTGATRTISRQNFTLGASPVAGYESAFFYRYAQSVAGSGGTFNNILQQAIEGVRSCAGETITVSFWAKADATRTVTPVFQQFFGTGGSPSATVSVSATAQVLTTEWARYSATVTIPSIAGNTLGTSLTDALILSLRSSTVNATQTIDIWGVQVESGSTVTPLERIPASEEMSLCQRYYVLGAINSGYYTVTNGVGAFAFYDSLPVSMRAIPTMTNLSFTNHDNAVNGGHGAVSSRQVYTKGYLQNSGFAYAFGSWTYSASAEL